MGIKTYMVKRVQDSAKKYGGHCTFPFSQALEPVSSMIGRSKITSGGICQALSEMWVVFHSHDGTLWNWLYPGGRLSSSALANVAYNFKYGSAGADGKFAALDNQDQNSDLWFLQYGIRRRTNAIAVMTTIGHRNGDLRQPIKVAQSQRSLAEGTRAGGVSRANLGRNLGRDLVSGSMVSNMGQGDGTYRVIGIYGGTDSHCMCAFVGTDVAFFDPNFGEFWFPDRASFGKWFGDSFWPKSFYDWMLSKSYSLRDYARAVGKGAETLIGKF